MKMSKRFRALLLAAPLYLASLQALAEAVITVDAGHPGHAVSTNLWGIFFEDINLSADGGIYPELVRNRSFEDGDQAEFWKITGSATMIVETSHPLNPLNPHHLCIRADGAFVLENAGYWGMNIGKGETYVFKAALRSGDALAGPLTIKLIGVDGHVLAVGEILSVGAEWKYQTVKLVALESDARARLEISAKGRGSLFLDMVSLLPEQTWKGHGLRKDLAESLNALHPSFVRFPGGCWVEGDDIAHMNHWKNTIRDVDARTPLWNIWGYNATHGLGFHEYLQMCEDLHAEPLFCINVGMSHKESIPLSQMHEWVQDALDAVEYANGPTNSTWGGLRAKSGHPEPFHLKYMEIGNENGGPDYLARWPLLVKALREKYPEIKCIANSDLRGGPYPKIPAPDFVDEHYYETPEAFMNRADQYDSYDRKGPKIFIGEYAVTKNCGKGNLRAAIGEAAFMTGMERNADIVAMASYAPLFVNLNHRAWNPDLINFDNSRCYGIPGYYVQQMFSENRGDNILPISVKCDLIEEADAHGQIGVGTWNTKAEFKDLKVTSPEGKVLLASDFSHGSEGWKLLGDGADWKVQDGALRQMAEKTGLRALAGDQSWTDYTLELKARKIAGSEGFLILFHVNGDDDNFWWNIGGWGNTRDAIELDGTLDSKPSHIETGRWYDLKIELKGTGIRCWLDGKLIHSITKLRRQTRQIYASATHDAATDDYILKVVNSAATNVTTTVDLRGAKKLTGKASEIFLTSASPLDENTLDEPRKVSPKTDEIQFTGNKLEKSFLGNSVTVLRIHSQAPGN